MITQKQFVRQCYDRYKAQGLTPGDPNDGHWEKAHYPLPQPEGDRWIWLLDKDHFVQGVIQSEEVGRCCFYVGTCSQYLESHWCEDWFEIFDLYEKWSLDLSRQAGFRTVKTQTGVHNPANIQEVREGNRKGGQITGKRMVDLGKGLYDPANIEAVREGNRKGGQNLSTADKQRGGRKGGESTNRQKWMSTFNGFISAPSQVANHNRRIGADPTARIRLTDAQYQTLRLLPQDQRLGALRTWFFICDELIYLLDPVG